MNPPTWHSIHLISWPGFFAIGKAQPDLYSRQFCGSWWVSWHISNEAELISWRAKKSGKIGSFFKVWSGAFRRVISQTFAGSQRLNQFPEAAKFLRWTQGSTLPPYHVLDQMFQAFQLFFHLKAWRSLWLGQWRFGSQSCQWKFTGKLPNVNQGLNELYTAAVNATSAEPRRGLHETQITSLDGSMIHRQDWWSLLDKSEWSSETLNNSWFIPEFLKEPKASSRSSAGHQWCHGHHAAPEWRVLTAATVPAVQRKEGKVDVCRGPAGSPKRRGRYRYLLNIDRSMVQVKTFFNTSCCTSTWLNPLTQLWWNFKEHILQLKSQIFKKMHVSVCHTTSLSIHLFRLRRLAQRCASCDSRLVLLPCTEAWIASCTKKQQKFSGYSGWKRCIFFFVAESEDRSAPSGHH